LKISKYENIFLCAHDGKHSFAGPKRKHSFAESAKPWVKRHLLIIAISIARSEKNEHESTKLPISPSEKSITLSENVPKSIGISENVFSGFLGEKGLFC